MRWTARTQTEKYIHRVYFIVFFFLNYILKKGAKLYYLKKKLKIVKLKRSYYSV